MNNEVDMEKHGVVCITTMMEGEHKSEHSRVESGIIECQTNFYTCSILFSRNRQLLRMLIRKISTSSHF